MASWSRLALPAISTSRNPGTEQEALLEFERVQERIFGRDLVEVPFFTKYELTSDIPADRAQPIWSRRITEHSSTST